MERTFDFKDVYYGLGFDGTEPQRMAKLNAIGGHRANRGIPSRIKKYSRLEYGTLSPYGIHEISILVTLIAASDVVRDKTWMDDEGKLEVEPVVYINTYFSLEKRYNESAIIGGGGKFYYHRNVKDKRDTSLNPLLPETYEDAIEQAKGCNELRNALNHHSGGDLGDRLIGALQERADLILAQMQQGTWQFIDKTMGLTR